MKMLRNLLLAALLLAAGGAGAQQSPPAGKAVRPFVLGEIHELTSKILGEKRVLNIYLPEGYRANDTARYPVVYLLDGSADEDFIHVSGLYQFYSFPWIQEVRPSIVVGIATVDRRRDFTYPTTIAGDKAKYPTTGGSATFIDFLQKELQPYIQKTFRTDGGTTLIGQSLGGLLAAEILITRPQLFQQYVIVSPSLWWDKGSLLNRDAVTDALPTRVYIGVGKEGLTPGPNPHMMEVDAGLLAEKIQKQKNRVVYFDYLPAEDHATILHQAAANAIRWFYRQQHK